MNNLMVSYFKDINREVFVENIMHFDKLGLFQPLTFRIEKQENA